MKTNNLNSLLIGDATAATIIVLSMMLKKKRKGRLWCRPWLLRRTSGRGILHLLNDELRVEDPSCYKNYLRINSAQFESLLNSITPLIKKQNTRMRDCIPERSKLDITLRFLATGESYRSLMYSTRIHESTISKFVPEVCDAISVKFKRYLKTPSTAEEWKAVAEEFDEFWQFPNCLGALDGKHISFRPPSSEGSYYYNYKGTNSIVLLALADAKCKFIYVNIGVNGRISDGGVFHQSNLGKMLENGELHFPNKIPLPGQQDLTPYVIIADDAFPMCDNLIKPYPQKGLTLDKKIFNYRLSRARRVVENSFGILANRFRVLLTPINLSPDKVELITLCCVILHNYLIDDKNYGDVKKSDMEESLKRMCNISQQGGNRSASSSRGVRDNFKTFFNSQLGTVPWQDRQVEKYNF